MATLYRIRDLSKVHQSDTAAFRLRVPELQVSAGEKVALVGPSGCGKSTLLDVLALVTRPERARLFSFRPEGQVLKVAEYWNRNDQNQLGDLRSKHIGYVLQSGGLLPFISCYDNIALSLRLLGRPVDKRVRELARELGIEAQLKKLPSQLSAGQRQRVAIARALAHKPNVVLADEPTSSLDPVTGARVMEMFMELVEDNGVTLILATHDWPAVERFGLRSLEFEAQQADDGTVEGVFRG